MKEKAQIGTIARLLELHSPLRHTIIKEEQIQEKKEFHEFHAKNGVNRKQRREAYRDWKKNK